MILLVLPEVSVLMFQNLMLYMYRPIVYISYIWFLQIQMLISIEYYIMRYLIMFEKDKSLGEITFEYSNTVVFREEEHNLVKKIKIAYFIINVLWIGGWLSNSTYDSVFSHNYPCNDHRPSKEEE